MAWTQDKFNWTRSIGWHGHRIRLQTSPGRGHRDPRWSAQVWGFGLMWLVWRIAVGVGREGWYRDILITMNTDHQSVFLFCHINVSF